MRQVVSIVVALVLLAVGLVAFTGYVAYCGKLDIAKAFEMPPGEDAARLGAVLEAALSWAMRACGAVVTILGAALAVGRGSPGRALSSAVVVLAGVVLISQHWASGIALGVVALAVVVGMTLRRPVSPDRNMA
jgi:hypothetical protein